jgi:hypothetical protein
MMTTTTETKSPNFTTESLYLAAALIARGLECTLTRQPRPNNRYIFEFEDARAGDLAAAFIQSNLPIDAQTLFARYDDLRTLVRRGTLEEKI